MVKKVNKMASFSEIWRGHLVESSLEGLFIHFLCQKMIVIV